MHFALRENLAQLDCQYSIVNSVASLAVVLALPLNEFIMFLIITGAILVSGSDLLPQAKR